MFISTACKLKYHNNNMIMNNGFAYIKFIQNMYEYHINITVLIWFNYSFLFIHIQILEIHNYHLSKYNHEYNVTFSP